MNLNCVVSYLFILDLVLCSLHSRKSHHIKPEESLSAPFSGYVDAIITTPSDPTNGAVLHSRIRLNVMKMNIDIDVPPSWEIFVRPGEAVESGTILATTTKQETKGKEDDEEQNDY